jgi:hypothetical protein
MFEIQEEEEVTANENSEISYATVGRFAAIPHSFIEGSKHLSLHARWLFVALMYFRNNRTGVAYPTYETLVRLTGMSKNMISKAIKELEDKEQDWVWLDRDLRFGCSTIYRLLLPRPGETDDDTFF